MYHFWHWVVLNKNTCTIFQLSSLLLHTLPSCPRLPKPEFGQFAPRLMQGPTPFRIGKSIEASKVRSSASPACSSRLRHAVSQINKRRLIPLTISTNLCCVIHCSLNRPNITTRIRDFAKPLQESPVTTLGMPSSRQFKVIGFVTLIAILVLYYISNGARETYESDFYQRTVAAIEKSKDAAARQMVADDERQRAERVERLRQEHNVATATTEAKAAALPVEKQQPIVEEKPVAGRKKTSDKVVQAKPGQDNDDGVAKVGNVRGNTRPEKEPSETDEEHEVEVLLTEILKKGPIIVFSKSYCPFSKKAKVFITRFGVRRDLDTDKNNSTSSKIYTTSHLHRM